MLVVAVLVWLVFYLSVQHHYLSVALVFREGYWMLVVFQVFGQIGQQIECVLAWLVSYR